MAWALLAVLVCPVVLRAEQPQSYTQRTWQTSDGLPEQIVQAFAQTKNHYLWIGTSGGLLRFDGAQFVTYSRDNVPAFTDDNIFCLMVADDDSLWIGSEGGGLLRYQHGSFRSFSGADGLTNSFVRVVYQDSKGQIWIGTDGGLLRVRNERLERIDNTSTVPALTVHAIFEDSRGALWVGGSRLLRLNGDTAVEYHLEGGYSQNTVKSITETRNGTVWVGTISGLQKMSRINGERAFSKVVDVRGTVRFLHETSDGTLWAGTIGNGVYTFRDGRSTNMGVHDGLPSDTALNLFEDAEKNIWIGTQSGMLRLSKTAVNTVSLPDAGEADAGTIFADSNGDLWVASAHLFQLQKGKATRFEVPGVSARIRNVFRDSGGGLWIGTEGQGAIRIQGNKKDHYTTQTGLVSNFIRVFAQGRDGSVWIGTDWSVTRWHPDGKLTNYQMVDGLCYFSIRALLQDRSGDVWIGTDHGLSRLHAGVFQRDAVTDALKEEKIWAIHEDSDGGLWFGTRTGGLFRWRSGKLARFTAAQGLASNSIYEILEDKNENFWLSGPNGISVVSRRELDGIADKGWHPIALTLYGVSNGLEKTQLYGGEKPAGVLTSSGEVWFPSNRGPVRIAIDQTAPADVPPVIIDRLVVDGVQTPGSAPISIGPDNVNLEIHYSIVLLRSQERVRFRYKLEGFDSSWVDASSRRVAYYTNLPAGKYNFRVAAFEMNTPADVAESSICITKKPHFYRTRWFLSLCVLLLAAAVWGVYKFRVGQLRARFSAVLKERARLAREMHDTLIQGCTSTSALLEAYSSMGTKKRDGGGELLDIARTQLRSTINEAREAVWDLRHQTTALTSIVPLLESIAAQVEHDCGVQVTCSGTGRAFDLEQSTANELLMIVREALYNAVRHGSPAKVQISCSFDHGMVSVTVQDDGCGFDPDGEDTKAERHYGVIGMGERAQRIGGQLEICSRLGEGTKVKIKVPRRSSAVIERSAHIES